MVAKVLSIAWKIGSDFTCNKEMQFFSLSSQFPLLHSAVGNMPENGTEWYGMEIENPI